VSNQKIFFIYTCPDCPFCDKAKSFLDSLGHRYISKEMSWDDDTLSFLKEQMSWKTVPMIFEIDNRDYKFVGGYTDLVKYLGGEDD
tara:strand:- start:503 stop:760 length:258 start_codon:yes stop_codon:yes gene_type:complete